jgi:Rad3-related DNA helicase
VICLGEKEQAFVRGAWKQEDGMPDNIYLSVRSLVEYGYRSGSIEPGFRTSSTMTEGTKAHQRIQSSYGEADRKEVYLKAELPYRGLVFVLEGRCDGLLVSGDGVTIDEIKSTVRDLPAIEEETRPVHWAQAKCYAYIVAMDQGLSEIGVQLTYVKAGSEERKAFRKSAALKELQSFIMDLLERYYPYAAMRVRHEEERNASIRELTFPFERFREGQRKLAGAVYTSIAEGKDMFVKAPTGIGKTISTLFPSVKAIGEGQLQRICYLTAKTITRTAAEEAFALMEDNGLHIHRVTLTAKDKVCYQDETRCTKEYCEFSDGYYDRVNEAITDMLSHETGMSRQVIETYARKHRVCPFEFSLDAAYASDAIICDYNYIFDPRVSLKRLFEDQKRRTALLVDEAHNLVERARDMYSAELQKSVFLELQRAYKGSGGVYASAKRINDYFLAYRKSHEGQRTTATDGVPEQLAELLGDFIAQAEKELAAGTGAQASELLLDAYYAAQAFERIARQFDERYVTHAEIVRSEVRMKLLCLDPSGQLRQMAKGFRAKVLFSATLSPMSFYIDMLGGTADDYAVSIPTPFAKEQWDVRILPLSTRYRDRESSKGPIAALVRRVARERPGNHLVFFPSYEYMNEVLQTYKSDGAEPGVQTLVQNTGMTEEERERFLAAFQAGSVHTLVGFAVLGGIFSEGIDLQGDRLNGVIVVGVGLPQLNPERDLIKHYMNAIGKNGYDYAYVYPGMNKVLQAGGRLIRSETDRGTIVLVDDRFLQAKYQRLLPDEWKDYTILRQENPY